MAGVNAYKDGVIAKMYKGLQGLIKSRGITYVEGEGRLTSPTAVQVGDSDSNSSQYFCTSASRSAIGTTEFASPQSSACLAL